MSSVPFFPAHLTAAIGQSNEQKEEESLVHSDLWKTLFRGGYMVGKLTRSLSGAYVSHNFLMLSTPRVLSGVCCVLLCRQPVLLTQH